MKRGPKPKGKVKIEWSANFAYAIGLFVTDGCVYGDRRHVSFVSKDFEQIRNIMRCLNIHSNIGHNYSGYKFSHTYRIQIGDVNFVKFLLQIGIGPAKSKVLKEIAIPSEYFFHFLRGVFDGDGYIHSYYDRRWKVSFLWYLGFCSASPVFLSWIRWELLNRINVKGHVTKSKNSSCFQLKYAKSEAEKIMTHLYMGGEILYLTRKKLKFEAILAIVRTLKSLEG
ncbi:MAG: LAGLIDADG family homing endonuclease [Candidatus Taylorbacteria bacterium]